MNNDLISRSALLKSFERRCLGACAFCPHAIYSPEEPKITCGLVQCAPAVDAEPVQHGRWLDMQDDYTTEGMWRCSVCGDDRYFDIMTPTECGVYYCPACGAKMEQR